METIAIIIAVIVGIGIIAYFRQSKATRRAQEALKRNNLFIYPAKEDNMYIIRDNNTKDILAIAKDLNDRIREYIVFNESEDIDRVCLIVFDTKDSVLQSCYVDENGNTTELNYISDFLPDHTEIKCIGNIQNHSWFHSKTGNTYRIHES